jgi:hypothetical protein
MPTADFDQPVVFPISLEDPTITFEADVWDVRLDPPRWERECIQHEPEDYSQIGEKNTYWPGNTVAPEPVSLDDENRERKKDEVSRFSEGDWRKKAEPPPEVDYKQESIPWSEQAV